MKKQLFLLMSEFRRKCLIVLLALLCITETAGAEIVDLIALNSAPEDEMGANVGIIGLNNAELAPPAGFERGFRTTRENGHQIRYLVMPGDPNAWSALIGDGIEYWQNPNGETLGVELCAGPYSRGVKQRFTMEATNKDFCGGYALVWNHYGRVPKSGSLDYSYTVKITAGDPSSKDAQTIGTPLVIDSERVPAGATARECFFFGIDESDLPAIEKNGLWISIAPNSAGTFSAVVSRIRIVKICMAVDKNRDGIVSFGGDDFTSASEPYRFWINNDCDKSGISEDDVSSIDRSGSAEPDCNNKKPESIRDLEDFSRLQIRFFGDESGINWLRDQLDSGEIKASLITHGGNVPELRVVEHLDTNGSLRYLYDAGTATKDVSLSSKKSYVSIAVSEVADWTKTVLGWLWGLVKKTENEASEPQNYFRLNFNADAQANFLFEGTREGAGRFSLVFSRADTHLQETATVWLELLDVRKMFERVSATPSEIPTPNSESWTPQPHSSFSFVNSDSLANKEVISKEFPEDTRIIFVHGWNMSFDEVQSYGATAFKRLWWQSYKGKFSVFYWPTLHTLKYNESEFRAWEYGESLKNYIIEKTEQGESVSVAAHSMGNFVTGSALKKGAPIVAYALLNSAVPAECYDGRLEIRDEFTSGISLGNSKNEQRLSLAYLNSLSQASPTQFINFYLERDKATSFYWEKNRNYLKPVDGYTVSAYDILPYYNKFFGSTRVVNYRHEAMSMCDKPYSRATGREHRILFNSPYRSQNEDLAQFGFGETHSAQFVFPIQTTFFFWQTLKSRLTPKEIK